MGHPAVAEAAVIRCPSAKWCGAAAGRGRAEARARPRRQRSSRLPRPELREVVAAGRVRVHRGDPADRGRKVQQEGAARAVRRADRRRPRRWANSSRPSSTAQVAVVTINHPPVNALSAPLLEELEAEIDRLDADDDDITRSCWSVRGERAFVAGADISEFPSLREAAADAQESGAARGIQKLGHRMDAARTPFIAAIRPASASAGDSSSLCAATSGSCSEDAQLGQPEIKLGLIPGGGGTQRLPRLIGIGRAQYLNMTGDFIDASTAYDWGLVEKVVPRGSCARRRSESRQRSRHAHGCRSRDSSRARAHDARPLARGGSATRGRWLHALPRVRGRSRGRGRLLREARPSFHGSVRAAVLRGVGGPEQLVVGRNA